MSNYTYLKLGDRLPTVGVAQKLLNAHNIPISVDGIFGQETREAVLQFQERNNISANGAIEIITWNLLSLGRGLSIVDTIDIAEDFTRRPVRLSGESDQDYNEVKLRYEHRSSSLYQVEYDDIMSTGGVPITTGGASNGTQDLIEQIRRAYNNIFLLRFHGHGGDGQAGISEGEGIEIGHHTFLNTEEVNRLRVQFAQLGRSFGRYGCIQFMQCSVAEGRRGQHFLDTLADNVGVPVTGAISLQLGGGVSTFKFEGPTYTAVPHGGTLRSWCSRLPNFPLHT